VDKDGFFELSAQNIHTHRRKILNIPFVSSVFNLSFINRCLWKKWGKMGENLWIHDRSLL